MTYTVHYRRPGQWFWRVLDGVKGDFVAHDLPGPARVFVLEDEGRVELPAPGLELRFSKERFIVIKQRMDREAGQTLPVEAPK